MILYRRATTNGSPVPYGPRIDAYYFLTFSDGSRLEIITKPDLTDSGNLLDRFGYAHIAFSAGRKEAVDELTTRLNAGGYPTLSGPRVTGDGYYESCVLGFEGNIIEITV